MRGLAPIAPEYARVLVLGSFPSAASLALGEYYGFGRNHFWPLLALAFGEAEPGSWAGKLALLQRRNVALWDVIAACDREGSLDEAIRNEEANDVLGLLSARTGIARVALNGGKAAASFRKLLAPELPAGLAIGETVVWRPPALAPRAFSVCRLPSTSPIPTRDFRGPADKAGLWRTFLSPEVPL
ncbi:MAG TPA: DNA-deoxyinosine glycosylase [Spirochaetia bacterium]|nr:DNA-deoxyinosine glycosylase [Spirochaetia bacterium]